MIDEKVFLKGFLQYLAQYYGLQGEQRALATSVVNTLKVPLFSQKADVPQDMEQMEAMMEPEDPMMEAPAWPMGGLGAPPMSMGQGGGPMGMGLQANELNGMFPGPYSQGM